MVMDEPEDIKQRALQKREGGCWFLSGLDGPKSLTYGRINGPSGLPSRVRRQDVRLFRYGGLVAGQWHGIMLEIV